MDEKRVESNGNGWKTCWKYWKMVEKLVENNGKWLRNSLKTIENGWEPTCWEQLKMVEKLVENNGKWLRNLLKIMENGEKLIEIIENGW